jgi:hypothetical protein
MYALLKWRRNKLDLLVVLLCPLFASFVSFGLNVGAFVSILLFFGLPALYISARNYAYIQKAFVFALCTSIPAIVIIDYIAHVSGQWLIPHSILPWRLFGYVTIEVVLWAFLNFYAVILFYEFFLSHHHTKRVWNHRGKYLLLFVLGISVLFLTLFFAYPTALTIPYFYLLFGTFTVLLPIIKELSDHPKLISNFFVTAVYFFYLSFLYEITALKLDWWRFPSEEFIGKVTLLNVSFPFEELLFWLFLFAMAVLTFYEHYTGNEKKA